MERQLEMYSAEWWRQARELTDRQVHYCFKCHRRQGEVKNVRRNALATGSDASVRRVNVRLVLLDGKPLLACERCVKPEKEPAEDKKLINELTLPMFGNGGQP